jgi:hypothetical protein
MGGFETAEHVRDLPTSRHTQNGGLAYQHVMSQPRGSAATSTVEGDRE